MTAKIKINEILKKGKALFLAYDQGLEHGPTDFNDDNVDPEYVINIANKGKFTGIILQKGVAEKYKGKIKVPLILKLNGKTNLVEGDPISRQLCSFEEAMSLGAKAVGYTIYLGSKHESEMLSEFEKIQEKAHDKNIPVIAWIYPRGESIKDEKSRELLAYSARTGLEIGADIIKIKYNGNKKDLEWAVNSAGKTKVVIAGGVKKGQEEFLEQVKEITDVGCIGLAVGRNIWQDKNPLRLTKKIKKIIWKN